MTERQPTHRADPVLQCRNIHKHLGSGEGRVHVLKGVGLDLLPGRIYSIVGPSGCGKSTLMYLLGLLDRPDEGEIMLQGKDMSQVSDDERTAVRNAHVGFVFQFHFLLAEFTALENLILPMRKLRTMSENEMVDRAHSLLTEVGLGEKTHRLANQLSGGEQQRVAVARALSNNPSVIFADEPTGNLDVKNSTIVFDLLRRLSHEHGQAILMVTHNPSLAKLCDETLEMMDGEFVHR
ncbi:MAG: ABC transporter ATP-binding protein [Puniceicoccaceae bacterium]